MFSRYEYRFGRYDLFLSTKMVGMVKKTSVNLYHRFRLIYANLNEEDKIHEYYSRLKLMIQAPIYMLVFRQNVL